MVGTEYDHRGSVANLPIAVGVGRFAAELPADAARLRGETVEARAMTTRPLQRLRLEVRGAVQGVGFRPYVFRLAEELDLAGWVSNDQRGVTLEVEGPADHLEAFLARFPDELPPRAVVHSFEPSWLVPAELSGFAIRRSDQAGAKSAVILPDIATCGDCLAELFDPADRRYLYPFTNCTNCGPRFSFILELPYDRSRTTMADFELCPDCAREYADPRDRRFHAQPDACPRCGPQLSLDDSSGETLAVAGEALEAAVMALAAGRIVAVKGLGGFHLMVDAGDEAAVRRLRRRKGRYEKPLALMVADLEAARRLCTVDPWAARELTSPEAPIVLLPARTEVGRGGGVAAAVAPGNPFLGVMLPSTPLHHLLLRRLGIPLVATSGNLSDEPICTGNGEARERLAAIADLFLVHDRQIARHVDDSVVAFVDGGRLPIRRARGFAPLPVQLAEGGDGAGGGEAILAVGAHLKNVVALSLGRRVFLSQHIGDMETVEAHAAFEQVIGDFLRLYEATPGVIAHDLHADYLSTRWAREAVAGEGARPEWERALRGRRLIAVQHHHAHLASCLADNGVEGRALGVIWDGTGMGTDGTVWGGEFLLGEAAGFERVASLRPFPLLGGEAAVRQPRRVALALLWDLYGEGGWEKLPAGLFASRERTPFERMLDRGLQSPMTTSAGRLFDGVAALLGLRREVSFEGQAAMELEFLAGAASGTADRSPYPLDLVESTGRPGAACQLDWRAMVEAVVEEVRRGIAASTIAARFHATLAEAICSLAGRIGESRVPLSGGCFQNRRLTELCCRRLRRAGFEVLLHRQGPPNDGGISLGQVAVARARLRAENNQKIGR